MPQHQGHLHCGSHQGFPWWPKTGLIKVLYEIILCKAAQWKRILFKIRKNLIEVSSWCKLFVSRTRCSWKTQWSKITDIGILQEYFGIHFWSVTISLGFRWFWFVGPTWWINATKSCGWRRKYMLSGCSKSQNYHNDVDKFNALVNVEAFQITITITTLLVTATMRTW